MALELFAPRKELELKSHVLLLARILEDSSIRCCTSTTRDLKTIASRVEDEGLSFLTITLPSFGSDFERSLDLGYVDPTLFQGFRRSGPLPAFLQGLVGQVFDRKTGVLLDDPSIECIQCVRQVSRLFSKLELPCSDTRVQSAFDGYVECEQSVRDSALDSGSELLARFRRLASLLFGDMFSVIDRKIYEGNVVPRHGPGSNASGIRGNAKYQARVWTDRLEEIFPAKDFLFTSDRHYFNSLEDGCGPHWLDPGAEPPVKVITVPKTQKSPRIIAMEPLHMGYVQQGIMELIYDAVGNDDKFLGRMIGFQDQVPNRTLACQGSRDLSLATLDLSEASDRVSRQHVDELTRHWGWLNAAVMACRSSKADVPGHGIVSLSKYASMGSALTFPLEAMVFLTTVFMGIEQERSTQLTREDIQILSGQVRVYGDDIVVPVQYVRSVILSLENFGFRVNKTKSFWTGRFRESCGGEYYAGYDVSVVRCRRELPTSRRHAPEIISAVSLRNQLYFAGYWRTAEYLDNILSRLIPFPTVGVDSPALGRHTYLDFYTVERVCPSLQRPLVKAAVPRTIIPQSYLGGEDALLKCFLKRGDEPFADRRHLERAGRPDAVDIKLRWVPPV